MASRLIGGTSVLLLTVWALGAQTATPITMPGRVGTPIALFGHSLTTSGMVGFAAGQTARLNLLNPRALAPGTTGGSCSAAVAFLDGQGNVLQSGTVTVEPGKSEAYDMGSSILGSAPRLEIRATVQVPPVIPPMGSMMPIAAPCNLVATLEIFDAATSRTTVVVDVAHFVWQPIPVATPTATAP